MNMNTLTTTSININIMDIVNIDQKD